MEEQLILRAPERIADVLRRFIRGEEQDIEISLTPVDGSGRFILQVGDEAFPTQLVDLPTVVESHKVTPDGMLYKAGEVGQMLFVQDPTAPAAAAGDFSAAASSSSSSSASARGPPLVRDPTPGADPNHMVLESGLSPPTAHIVKRRFRPASRFISKYGRDEIAEAERVLLAMISAPPAALAPPPTAGDEAPTGAGASSAASAPSAQPPTSAWGVCPPYEHVVEELVDAEAFMHPWYAASGGDNVTLVYEDGALVDVYQMQHSDGAAARYIVGTGKKEGAGVPVPPNEDGSFGQGALASTAAAVMPKIDLSGLDMGGGGGGGGAGMGQALAAAGWMGVGAPGGFGPGAAGGRGRGRRMQAAAAAASGSVSGIVPGLLGSSANGGDAYASGDPYWLDTSSGMAGAPGGGGGGGDDTGLLLFGGGGTGDLLPFDLAGGGGGGGGDGTGGFLGDGGMMMVAGDAGLGYGDDGIIMGGDGGAAGTGTGGAGSEQQLMGGAGGAEATLGQQDVDGGYGGSGYGDGAGGDAAGGPAYGGDVGGADATGSGMVVEGEAAAHGASLDAHTGAVGGSADAGVGVGGIGLFAGFGDDAAAAGGSAGYADTTTGAFDGAGASFAGGETGGAAFESVGADVGVDTGDEYLAPDGGVPYTADDGSAVPAAEAAGEAAAPAPAVLSIRDVPEAAALLSSLAVATKSLQTAQDALASIVTRRDTATLKALKDRWAAQIPGKQADVAREQGKVDAIRAELAALAASAGASMEGV